MTMDIEKLFKDYDVEPYTRVVDYELISTKLTPIGSITKIKNIVTRDVRYILQKKKTES